MRRNKKNRANKNRKNNNKLEVNEIIIETTDKNLIDCAGLFTFITFINKLGFLKLVDKRLPVPLRSDGYRPSEIVKTIFANIIIFGGKAPLERIDLLRQNKGIAKILEMKKIPSSSVVGDFLRRYANVELQKDGTRGGIENGLELLGNLFYEVAVMALKNLEKNKSFTLDVDAFVIEENKEYAKYTYKKTKGTMGFGGFVEGVCVLLELEPGNHSPNDNIFKRTESCIKLAKQARINIDKIREDAAGYVSELINYCINNNIKFYIRASKDAAVKESIKTIKELEEGKKAGYKKEDLEYCWQEKNINIAGNETTTKTVGIAVHAMENTEAFNLVTQRKEIITKPEKPDTTRLPGFENEPEIQRIYRAVATNDFDKLSKETIEFYNKRGDASENCNKELVSDYGVGRLPCGGEFGLETNRGYAYIVGMLYNLVQIFNRECVEEVEKEAETETEKKEGNKKKSYKHRLPTFTNNIIKVPALITYHGRRLTLKMSNYMIGMAEKFKMLLEKIKEKIKLYRTPKEAPDYIRLIFRNNSKHATAGGLPDDGTITETK